jgi:hypothetical protein
MVDWFIRIYSHNQSRDASCIEVWQFSTNKDARAIGENATGEFIGESRTEWAKRAARDDRRVPICDHVAQ